MKAHSFFVFFGLGIIMISTPLKGEDLNTLWALPSESVISHPVTSSSEYTFAYEEKAPTESELNSKLLEDKLDSRYNLFLGGEIPKDVDPNFTNTFTGESMPNTTSSMLHNFFNGEASDLNPYSSNYYAP